MDLYDKMKDYKDRILKRCDGKFYLPNDIPGKLKPTKCLIVLHYIYSLIEALIPKAYWWLSLETLNIDQAYIDVVTWYLDNLETAVLKGLGLLFLGANGIGKTSLMCEIGKYALIRKYKVVYFTAQQYIQAVKADDKDLISYFENSDFLLVDELDKVYIKKGSNFVTKTLEDFLRRMVSKGRILILGTNLNRESFVEVFGESTVSMLKRNLRFTAITGKDYSIDMQDNWNNELETKPDYFADVIMKNAELMWKKEQEDSEREWQKYYNRKNS